MADLPGPLRRWEASGSRVAADGVEVWHRVRGTGPWLVCLHGFPTSSWDWHRVLPDLEARFRVLVFDLPGYGLSAKPPARDYGLLRQVDAAEALLRHLGIQAFHLLSHDMGDTAACELVHRVNTGASGLRPRSWLLLNGGLYPELHRPLPTQRLLRTPVLGALTARLASWRVFMAQYPKCYAQPDRFGTDHYREQWSLILNNGGRRTLARVACYMHERLVHRQRWEAALHGPGIPVGALWGRLDPIAVPAIATRFAERNPRADVVMLDTIGHYPQLEAPGEVARAVFRLSERAEF